MVNESRVLETDGMMLRKCQLGGGPEQVYSSAKVQAVILMAVPRSPQPVASRLPAEDGTNDSSANKD